METEEIARGGQCGMPRWRLDLLATFYPSLFIFLLGFSPAEWQDARQEVVPTVQPPEGEGGVGA